MTSLLSGLMKISGKLPLASTADAMLPSPGHRRRGRVGEREGVQKGWLAPASEREILREFPRLISPALCARGRRASLISDVNC